MPDQRRAGTRQPRTKVHGVGERAIGGHRLTICNTFFAQGPHAVSTTDNPFDVTCQACIKKRGKG